jgi:hypothetical protein
MDRSPESFPSVQVEVSKLHAVFEAGLRKISPRKRPRSNPEFASSAHRLKINDAVRCFRRELRIAEASFHLAVARRARSSDQCQLVHM